MTVPSTFDGGTGPMNDPAAPARSIDLGVVLVVTLDADYRVTNANAAVAGAFGYRPAELLGLPVEVLAHADMPDEVLRDVRATIDAGATWSAPMKWRRIDGRPLWLKATFAPMRRTDRPDGCLVVGTRATELQIGAVERVYGAMRRTSLAWREAVTHCMTHPVDERSIRVGQIHQIH